MKHWKSVIGGLVSLTGLISLGVIAYSYSQIEKVIPQAGAPDFWLIFGIFGSVVMILLGIAIIGLDFELARLKKFAVKNMRELSIEAERGGSTGRVCVFTYSDGEYKGPTNWFERDSIWFKKGKKVKIKAKGSSKYGYVFEKWTGDIPPEKIKENPVILKMDKNREIKAHFEKEALMKKYKEATGKPAIWEGEATKQFEKWKSEQSNICPECGAELEPDAEFCIKCGYKLKSGEK